MSLNPQMFATSSETLGRVKQLFIPSASDRPEQEYRPHLYFEARIDYADVRSGFHMTCDRNDVLDLRPYEPEDSWTRDMVLRVDSAAVQNVRPPGAKMRTLPAYVNEEFLDRMEVQYLSYLLRHAEMRVFRNFALNLYSLPGEGGSDFQNRCLDGFHDSFRAELDALREVVNRRLERIEEKYISPDRAGEFASDRRMSQARSRLHAVAENIAEFFLQTEMTPDPVDLSAVPCMDPARPDLEQMLESLEVDVRRDVGRLVNSYSEKVRNIDEYILHPGLKDLHLVRKGILWMPIEVNRS